MTRALAAAFAVAAVAGPASEGAVAQELSPSTSRFLEVMGDESEAAGLGRTVTTQPQTFGSEAAPVVQTATGSFQINAAGWAELQMRGIQEFGLAIWSAEPRASKSDPFGIPDERQGDVTIFEDSYDLGAYLYRFDQVDAATAYLQDKVDSPGGSSFPEEFVHKKKRLRVGDDGDFLVTRRPVEGVNDEYAQGCASITRLGAVVLEVSSSCLPSKVSRVRRQLTRILRMLAD